ncbi:carbohydrate kinase family protein [Candidatus Parcubacteria bacterium]|nr:carbohydrate kinase family protein [Candidatus Parcubacteria bacterium]
MLKNRFDIITIGGAVKDFFIFINKGLNIKNKKNLFQQKLLSFEYGDKIYLDEFYSSIGGGACNRAVGFSRLGLKSAVKICVNKKKYGDYIINQLKNEKVDASFIDNNEKKEAGMSFILINKDKNPDRVILSHRGVNKFLKIDKKAKWNTDWIFLSSLENDGWVDEFKKIEQIVKTNKIRLAFGPGNIQISAGLNRLKNILKLSDVLVLNRKEAIKLTESGGKRRIEELLRILYNHGPRLITITDGKKGAYVYDGNKIYFQKAKKVKTIETTGAGDAFSSGFVSGIIKYDYNIKKSLNLGIRNGASVVQKIGAQQGLLRLKL